MLLKSRPSVGCVAANMTQHTPGPWRVDYHRNAGYLVVALNRKQHGGTNAVFTVRPSYRTSEAVAEARANAELAAAAPELLAALKPLAFFSGSLADEDDRERLHEMFASARAVIAKAEAA